MGPILWCAGMNPCSSYYVTSGAHSRDNPYRCASMEQTPTCGVSPVNPKHLLYYQLCSSPSNCGEVYGGIGSNSSLIMYMEYNPSSSSCSSTTVAYAAYCSIGDLGRCIHPSPSLAAHSAPLLHNACTVLLGAIHAAAVVCRSAATHLLN